MSLCHINDWQYGMSNLDWVKGVCENKALQIKGNAKQCPWGNISRTIVLTISGFNVFKCLAMSTFDLIFSTS
jgi:hypothetical protein